ISLWQRSRQQKFASQTRSRPRLTRMSWHGPPRIQPPRNLASSHHSEIIINIRSVEHMSAPEAKTTNQSETIRKHKEFLFPAVATYYQEPLALVKGEGAHVWDDRGDKYLDC